MERAGSGLGAPPLPGLTYPDAVAPGSIAATDVGARADAGRAAAAFDRVRAAAPLRIGVVFANDSGPAILKAFGVEIERGDPVTALEVAARLLNDQGGVAGRRVELVVWRYDGDRSPQDLCEHFTNDHRVFAVIRFGASGSVTRGCFGKRGMPTLDTVAAELSQADLERDRMHFLIAGMTLDRLGVLLVEGLAGHGFFANRDRVGVVTYDQDAYHRVVDRVVLPRLREHGHDDTEVVYLTHPSVDENKTAADASSAVLRFRQNGVRRVLIFEGTPFASGTFTAAARSQGASFRYGLATSSGPSMKFVQGKYAVDEEALRNATVVGWHSLGDLPYDQGGTREMPPAAQQWRRILAARGIAYSERCCALGYALAGIEQLRFLAAAVGAAGGRLDAVSFRAGVERLGTSYASLMTGTTRFGPGRHDGVEAYRIATWDGACPCLRYRTGPRGIPAG